MKIKSFNVDYEELIRNIDYYVSFLMKEGVIAFKEIGCSVRQQKEISLNINRALSFKPVDYDEFHILYKESHRHAIDSKVNQFDKILIDWHLEHPGSANPQVLATWNMKTFKCSKKSGNTGFVDAKKVLEKMNDEEVSFLRKCSILEANSSGVPVKYWVDEKGNRNETNARSAISKHPVLGSEVLRVDVLNNQALYYFDSRIPSEGESILFNSIYNKILYEVVENKDNQIWWEWSKGDLLIVDLFSMYHAVKGGFEPGQRVFTGFWSFIN